MRASPCADASQATLANDANGDLWCGCGDSGPGLFLLGSGNVEFKPVQDMQDTTVMDVAVSSDGKLVVAGESAQTGEPMLISTDIQSGISLGDDGPVVMADAWLDLTLTGEPDIDHNEVSMNSEGQIVVTDGVAASFYDGIAWSPATDFGSDAGFITSIESEGELFLASGTNSGDMPSVFNMSFDRADSVNLMVLAETEGQMNAITSLGSGEQMAVGSTVDGEILLARCSEGDCAAPDDWDMMPPGDAMPEEGDAMNIAFDSSGELGLMVGSMQSNTEGWVAITADGGLSWDKVEGDFPPLTDCTMDDNGSFVVMGEGDFSVIGDAGA